MVVVTDDAFADARPFFEIFRRRGPVCFDCVEIFNRDPQTVEDFTAGVDEIPQIDVCKCKVVRSGIIRVCVEVAKDIGYVDQDAASIRSAGIVSPDEWNSCVLEFRYFFISESDRTVVDSVQRFDSAAVVIEIKGKFHIISFFVIK